MNNEIYHFVHIKKFSVFRHFFDRHFDDISKPRMSQMSALKNKIDILDIDISPVGYNLTTLYNILIWNDGTNPKIVNFLDFNPRLFIAEMIKNIIIVC